MSLLSFCRRLDVTTPALRAAGKLTMGAAAGVRFAVRCDLEVCALHHALVLAAGVGISACHDGGEVDVVGLARASRGYRMPRPVASGDPA